MQRMRLSDWELCGHYVKLLRKVTCTQRQVCWSQSSASPSTLPFNGRQCQIWSVAQQKTQMASNSQKSAMPSTSPQPIVWCCCSKKGSHSQDLLHHSEIHVQFFYGYEGLRLHPVGSAHGDIKPSFFFVAMTLQLLIDLSAVKSHAKYAGGCILD